MVPMIHIDGVSEGQFKQVLDQELVALKSKFFFVLGFELSR